MTGNSVKRIKFTLPELRLFHYILTYLFILLAAGCSTKKNTFVSRTVHSTGARYNVLYNGNVALEQGKEALISSYVDNYWEILPVERMKVTEEETLLLSQKVKNPHFEKAEEKAAKAIQKHSMNIEGREYNPQMDEAYLLLGKARYYDQRFIPALEAFNYVLYKYWTSDKVNETRIWRAKTNIRLENERLALSHLKRLLRTEELTSQELARAHAVMGQAYINLKQKDSAVNAMKIAAAYTGNNEEKGRYYFITGQLYNRLGLRDSANRVFDKIIDLNRKTLRVYVINAHLEKIRNFNKDSVSDAGLLELITELEEDYENHPFLDKIYREKALFHATKDSIHLMEKYMNKSLRSATTDTYLKAYNYEYLAQFRFDNARYKDAGSYYDSTLVNLEKGTQKYRSIEKKRNSLNDVIKYEDMARETDSILQIVAMGDGERKAYFEQHIQTIKDAAQKEAEARERNAQDQTTIFSSPFTGSSGKSGKTEPVFYFYNPVTLQYGRNEFKRIWGDRPLEDNWRIRDKNIITGPEETTAAGKTVMEDQYNVAHYLDKIPAGKKVIDSIKTRRNNAYYQLGVLYKEKFGEYGLAIEKLETLLTREPEEKLALPARYHLYKIYETTQSPKAETVKNDIIARYPDSRYAALLKNPDAVLADDDRSPEMIYNRLFKTFEAQEYETVITQADSYISQHKGEPIAPKFEMLKALATGRLNGLEAYKEALKAIAANYPDDEEGKEAGRIVKEDLKTLEQTKFTEATPDSHWKLVFPLSRTEEEKAEKLLKTLTRSLEELHYDHLSVSKDIYDSSRIFIVVHGFSTEDRTLGYAELLNINKNYKVKEENFAITSHNYKTIQIHKNLETYKKEKLKT